MFRRTALAIGCALSLTAGFATTSEAALACANDGVTLTSIDGNAVNFDADACHGAVDTGGGTLTPAQVEALVESGSILGLSALDWDYLDKAESGDNAGDVQVSGFSQTGTWSADFTPMSVNKVVVLLFAANEYSLFLFDSFTPSPGSVFEGGFDMAKAGIENPGGNTPGLSHLEVAGIFVQQTGVIPLPAGLPLLLGGMAAFGVVRRMKRKA